MVPYILAVMFLLLSFPEQSLGEVIVIVHKDVPVDRITRTELIDLYTGDARHWDDGRPIVPFTLQMKTAAQESFFKLIGRSPFRMKSIWMKRMLSGEGDPPESMPSESAVVERVSSTPGAIGYVSRDSTDARVKTLTFRKKG